MPVVPCVELPLPETSRAPRLGLARAHDALAHCNLGVLSEKLGKDADAEASYREAIKVDPKDALPHFCLAGLLEKRSDFDGAIHEMRECIRKGGYPGIDSEARLTRLRAKKAARGGAASSGKGPAAPK